ncbi:hypothetical protein M885DRAFT_510982 [Pelagophyceae sp. CCMP2097]|nr:hypothetical protein M885DRAFT_510982 [Pelagophyceae sp. CCMP2097]
MRAALCVAAVAFAQPLPRGAEDAQGSARGAEPTRRRGWTGELPASPEERFSLYRFVVEAEAQRGWQYCVGEVQLFDPTGAPVAVVAASASATRPDADFGPDALADGDVHRDFCSPTPLGWFALRTRRPVEVSAYAVGSDCGEDTPTQWRLEACAGAGRNFQCAGGWKVLDARRGEEWRPGCGGEWRRFEVPAFRHARFSAEPNDWCLTRLNLLGADRRALRVLAVTPNTTLRGRNEDEADAVTAPQDGLDAGARARRAADDVARAKVVATKLAALVSEGPPAADESYCAKRDAMGTDPVTSTLVVALRRRASVAALRVGARQNCAALPPPAVVALEGCVLYGPDAPGTEAAGGQLCVRWKPLVAAAVDVSSGAPANEADACKLIWGTIEVPDGGVAAATERARAAKPDGDYDGHERSLSVAVSMPPGEARRMGRAGGDISSWEWHAHAGGELELRRTALAEHHLAELTVRLAAPRRVASATFAKNLTADILLGHEEPTSISVIWMNF